MATKKHKPKQRSTNPNNPTCSTTVQVCLDILKAGFPPQGTIEEFLELAKNNDDIYIKAEKIHKEHEYPDEDLTFFKGTRHLQVICGLSGTAAKVLYLMIQTMRSNNLIEVSISNLKDYADISATTAVKALDELKDKGCIAVRFPRNKTRGAVYMVNPLVGTTGSDKKNALLKIYWPLTGCEYKNGEFVKSKPYEEFFKAFNTQRYSEGSGKQEIENKKYTYFNRYNEPIKKDLPGGADKSKNNDDA